MGTLSGWTVGLCVAVAAAGIIYFLLPDEKENRAFDLLLGLTILCMLISPLAHLDISGIFGRESSYAQEEELIKAAQEQQLSYSGSQIQSALEEVLSLSEIPFEKIEVVMDIHENGRICCSEVYAVLQNREKTEEARYLIQSLVGKETEVQINVRERG